MSISIWGYVLRMLAFLGAIATIVFLTFPALEQFFFINPSLNGVILGVFAFGVLYMLRMVLRLRRDILWLVQFQSPTRAEYSRRHPAQPALLGALANVLADRKGRMALSAVSMRSLLDGVSARLDESREISRYLIGLLIFLGLLGTFWGLLGTIQSVGSVIGGLSIGSGTDVAAAFASLQSGLQAPLSGMGAAFSASLFGLAGSLALGFLDLQAGQAQNRFFQAVEDWLSGAARLPSGYVSETESSAPAYLEALLEQTAENIDALQRTMAQAEEGRRIANANLLALTEKLSALTDQMRTEQALMIKLAENQTELKPLIARLADAATQSGVFAPASSSQTSSDDDARRHLRNIDMTLSRLTEEIPAGRTQLTQELRNEIRLVARTFAALAAGDGNAR
ncbi:Flagellar motor protein MotA [Azospirillaceae bacterium]